MTKIRWYELAEARQPASLGKRLSKAGQQRLQWMLFYFFNGRNVARTCRHFGISRQTFYRWKRRFNRHDLTTLEGHAHRPRKVRQPTWTSELAERVLVLRKQYPRCGKDKLVVLLRRENRVVSTSRVGRRLLDLKRRGALHEPATPNSRLAATTPQAAQPPVRRSQA
jgi:transposase-like protein